MPRKKSSKKTSKNTETNTSLVTPENSDTQIQPEQIDQPQPTPNAPSSHAPGPSNSNSTSPSEMAAPVRLFIASVGNPAPYYNTLHSAGHHLLDTLSSSHLLSPTHTLYKSTSQMNVSGTNISRAYKRFLSSLDASERAAARIVILHDELELPLGQLKLRHSGSFKGHNGLKSVSGALGGKDFKRIGIGIGRPESREKGAVSDYVLRKMTNVERLRIQEKAELAAQLLEGIQ